MSDERWLRFRCSLRGHRVDDYVTRSPMGTADGSCECGKHTVHLGRGVTVMTVGKARIHNPPSPSSPTMEHR